MILTQASGVHGRTHFAPRCSEGLGRDRTGSSPPKGGQGPGGEDGVDEEVSKVGFVLERRKEGGKDAKNAKPVYPVLLENPNRGNGRSRNEWASAFRSLIAGARIN